MKLFARFWTGLVQLLSLQDYNQAPLLPTGPSNLPNTPGHGEIISPEPKPLRKGPVFQPPGIRPGSKFTCDYSNMIGWESCSTETDRSCWLKNSDMGQFDINTDYEALRPHGIMRNYTLNVKDGWLNADGQNFTNAKLFNDTYPGPWIQACWGDVLNITVVNDLQYNGTAIHWHGLRQFLTMHMDGVPGVTQCPIAPKDSFSYIINTTQYGSSWYHSHYSLQYADGLAGPITIHGPTSAPYDEPAEIPLLLTDWSHASMFQNDSLINGTILLNGRGNVTRFGCESQPNRCSNWTQIPTIETLHFDATPIYDKPYLKPRPKRYLLRIINTSFETQFVFSIDNHNLTVVTADFVPIQPYSTHAILVGIGQRYNLIVEANPIGPDNQGRKDFWIRTGIAKCFLHYTQNQQYYIEGYNVTGILTYRDGAPETPSSTPWTDISLDCKDEPSENLVPIVPWLVGPAANSIPASDSTGEERDVTLNGTAAGNPNYTYPLALFSLELPDHTQFNPLRVDYDNPMFFQLNQPLTHQWPTPSVVIPENLKETDWIYLLIQGNRANKQTSGAHPIHLHGHDFAILSQNYSGFFNPGDPLNTCNPARRDVVLLPTNGWVMIAFKADNPGDWLMHCHIAGHASFGLGAQILERQADANAIWPHPSDGSTNYCGKYQQSNALCRASQICDKWKTWHSDCRNWWAEKGQDPCKSKTNPWYFLPDSGI
nr:hypothetical protein LTR18_007685 [Exophiala xenobiotica]